MPKKSMTLKEARAVAEGIARELGYELVDVEFAKEPGGHFLRFYIDREEGIALDAVDYDYMEVSSPGVDRPLKTERDFEHAQGTTVEVKTYRAIDGSKQFVGDLIGLRGDEIVIQIGPDQEMAFHKKDVAVVREYIDFDESDLEDDVPVQ